jgi:hypothetical protein
MRFEEFELASPVRPHSAYKLALERFDCDAATHGFICIVEGVRVYFDPSGPSRAGPDQFQLGAEQRPFPTSMCPFSSIPPSMPPPRTRINPPPQPPFPLPGPDSWLPLHQGLGARARGTLAGGRGEWVQHT